MYLYEYLIGGRKIGMTQSIEPFSKLGKGDIFWQYAIDKKLGQIEGSECYIKDITTKDNWGIIIYQMEGENFRKSFRENEYTKDIIISGSGERIKTIFSTHTLTDNEIWFLLKK